MKILYGVPGEGMGHATRSKEVVAFLLLRGHEVHIVSSHKAFAFLEKEFPGRVHQIKGFHFGFEDGKVSKWETFKVNLKSGPKNLLFNFREFLSVNSNFNPDLVISDFESFSWAFARLHRLPLISIDNMQVMDRCKLSIGIAREENSNYKLAKTIVRAKVPGAKKYFITSFFEAESVKQNSIIVPPIIRTAIQMAKVSVKHHILVYQSAGSSAKLAQVFRKFPSERFIIYGSKEKNTDGNIQYKPFSEQEFIDDFASCKAVIANGGFSFLSEAVYLHKPVYSYPLPGQFEQYMNAAYIEKCGYGMNVNTVDSATLSEFLSRIPEFRKNLAPYQQEGNSKLFSLLEKELRKY